MILSEGRFRVPAIAVAALCVLSLIDLFAYKGSVEIPVNARTEGDQESPAVAMAPDGKFVVVWAGDDQDGSETGIIGRLYDAAGLPLTQEFVVNSDTVDFQRNPAVAMKKDGSFIVVWESYCLSLELDGSSPFYTEICARRFDRLGRALGKEFLVNVTFLAYQRSPEIGIDDRGNFVVAWQSWEQDGSCEGVFARRFNAQGRPVGGEFQVNTTTQGYQDEAAVAVDRSGNFLIAWEGPEGIYVRRYDSKGKASGPELRINQYRKGFTWYPKAAADPSGSFVVAWQSDKQDGDSWGVYARRLNAQGQPAGPEFPVNKTRASLQTRPSIAVDGSGNLLAAWQSYGQDGDNYGIFCRAFSRAGKALSPDLRANLYTSSVQDGARIAADGSGNFVVVWQSALQDGSGSGVYARIFKK